LQKEHLQKSFRERFGHDASMFRAPGRVNLIGEHTDYNDGFVFPAAIDLFTWVAISPRTDGRLIVYSENFRERVAFSLDETIAAEPRHWSTYVRSVAAVLQRDGHRLAGANLVISGQIPLGAGLSSSASLEVAVGEALLENSALNLDPRKLARACQRAENEFVGTRCGIMDQLASACGVRDHAILLDCRSLDLRAVRLPADVRLVICNTMVPRELALSAYNTRRQECEEGLRVLTVAYPQIRALRDANLEQLENRREFMTETVYRRCRHVITEIARTLKTANALEQSQLGEVGRAMAESHRSLRDDFEVSSAELDLLVGIAEKMDGVLGARMTGGGFGGCTINLVYSAQVEAFKEHLSREYCTRTGLMPEIYACTAADGAGRVD
jgi:galactokinase